nr:transposase [Bacillus marinisedimentorum]
MFYHIVCRRNHREALFLDDRDFSTFLYILYDIHEKTPFELPCYCLMTNHFHLILRAHDQSISSVMALLNKRYASYYNNRYHLKGHLFEERFYSKVIYGDKGMLEVSRYIHMNPVRAGMVSDPAEYPWSSYPFYSTEIKDTPRYMNRSEILGALSGNMADSLSQYDSFCRKLED